MNKRIFRRLYCYSLREAFTLPTLVVVKRKLYDEKTKSHNDYIPTIDCSIGFMVFLFRKNIKKKRKLFLGFKLMFQSSFILKLLRCRLFC